MYNLSKRPILAITTVVYGYDADGRQVARTAPARQRHDGFDAMFVEPGGHTELAFAADPPPPSAVAFEVCYDNIRFAGDVVSRVSGHCPDQKPRGQAFVRDRELRVVRELDRQAGLLRTVNTAFERAHPDTVIAVEPRDPVDGPLRHPSDLEIVDGSFALPRPDGDWDARLPLALIPISIVYNLPIERELQLSTTAIAKIFKGEIASWDDPRIAQDNPGIAMPHLPVVMKLSGHQAALASLLCATVPAECVDHRLVYDWQASEAHKDDIRTTPGAITFLAMPEARATQLPAARVRNAAGAYVSPSGAHATQAGLDAALDPDLAFQAFGLERDALDAPPIAFPAKHKDAYPLVIVLWAYVGYADFVWDGPVLNVRPITPDVARYLQFALRDGQAAFEAQGLGRLPARTLEQALAHLSQVKDHGLAAAHSRRHDPAAWIQHITIGAHSDSAPQITRTPAEARILAQKVLARVRRGGDMAALGRQFSDDKAAEFLTDEITSSHSYAGVAGLATSLRVGEVGLVRDPAAGSWVIVKRVAPPPPEPLESAAILRRTSTVDRATLRHARIGWTIFDARFQQTGKRNRAEAEKLVKATLARIARGESFADLFASIDPTATLYGHDVYDSIRKEAPFNARYNDLALRLRIGEVGVVRCRDGYYIVQRID
jgi:ABC-type phosphate transport system substrate-binding protein